MLKTIFVHLHKLLITELILLFLVVYTFGVLISRRHNLNLLVVDINLCLFEFQLIFKVDKLFLKSPLLLLGLRAKLRSMLENFLERCALVLGGRRVPDLRVKFLPHAYTFLFLLLILGTHHC